MCVVARARARVHACVHACVCVSSVCHVCVCVDSLDVGSLTESVLH